MKEFVVYGSKYNPKLSKLCKICNDYRRFENERYKRGEFKEEWYWNGQLIRRLDEDPGQGVTSPY